MSALLVVNVRLNASCLKCLQLAKIGVSYPIHRHFCGSFQKNNKIITNKSKGLCYFGKHHISQWRHSAKFSEVDRELLDGEDVKRVEQSSREGPIQVEQSAKDGIIQAEQSTRDGVKGMPHSDNVHEQTTAQSSISDSNTNAKQRPPLRNFSLHFPKSSVILNIDAKISTPEVTFHIPDTSSIINVNLETPVPVDDTNPSQHIESVEEHMWREVTIDKSKLLQHYLKLSKIRLTGLVVVTTMAGYAIAPGTFHIGTFLLCSAGTTLTSCAANAMNQYFEIPFDSQMNRTKNRVLVRGHLSSLHAVTFSVITSMLGLTILTVGVNPLTAALGAFNLGLYTLVYTPMKRYSIANTWVGSVVGAIPPVMGWTACTGSIDTGALLLSAIMYAWQFPHFNALSWNLRPDYSRSGYRMTSVVNPALCKRVALRYSAGMIGLCTLAPVLEVTTWTFAVDSFPLNAYLTYLAWQFYRKGDSNSSRKLFRFTLGHIPVLLILMLVSKKSLGDKQPVAHTESAETVNLYTKDDV